MVKLLERFQQDERSIADVLAREEAPSSSESLTSLFEELALDNHSFDRWVGTPNRKSTTQHARRQSLLSPTTARVNKSRLRN